ncbi:MAG: iron ABC transporter permease, partial [Treponema sp.]|nr:iron ABC transporter permease [Treponema sp.]
MNDSVDFRTLYARQTQKRLLLILLMAGLLFACCVAGLSVGGASYSIRESWNAILAGPGNENSDIRQRIIWVLRVPRVLMGVVSGIGLATAGLMMQTILRN